MEIVFRGSPRALRLFFAGAIPVSARAMRKKGIEIVYEPGDAPLASFPTAITKRESDVLDLVAQGLSNKTIGEMMGISQRTVEAHLRSLMRRKGAHNRTQLALMWARFHPL